MDILYNVDELYLQALDELNYGETPKAMHYFNTIIGKDPDYARAYYQLGHLYFYEFKNYQTAGFYLKKCIELDPNFPDVYVHYLKLLITLKMQKSIQQTADKAITTPGVCHACIYEQLGAYAEQCLDLVTAEVHYQKAAALATDPDEADDLQKHIKRVSGKVKAKQKMVYSYND
ncbi:tetratricopeptide repeat protein [Mucilaginibacter myungsuensis]|uniref:Tetratricopeptide repeat protein n=1 Tax=Mucilaginibacter myungsuensis TaxID=649104 RepID=A0A929PXY5_9SPHI|nr:hypothetical protein [Mucilaginibacter myungsuensis]MBE9663619.1 hypothetical protein [Mucilaginibacter myungsuensis]MDN3599057.1 hypothetical protein [Mucilaginibacter myungsuensis]